MTLDGVLDWIRGHKLIVGLIIVALVIFAWILPTINSTRDAGIGMETALSAQYQDNQNYLSAFISGFHEQVGIAQAQGDQLNQVLTDAVKGRYDDGGFQVGSALFSGIVEAYPEASLVELQKSWGKIQDYIQAERAGYRNIQSKLLDQLRAYDRWRQKGLFRHMIVNMYFPSDNLEARLPSGTATGEEARAQMYRIVLTEEAAEAYETGEMAPLEVESNN